MGGITTSLFWGVHMRHDALVPPNPADALVLPTPLWELRFALAAGVGALAVGAEGLAGGLDDGILSGAEWDGAVCGGVLADQSEALLGDEQCSGGGAGECCGWWGGDGCGVGEEGAVGSGAGGGVSELELGLCERAVSL